MVEPIETACSLKYLTVKREEDLEQYIDRIRQSAAQTQAWLTAFEGDPLDLLYQMKFEKIGRHPIDLHELNIIEQINQTWTYAVALMATKQLLKMHPDVGGFKVAPGAHMSLPLDIMSFEEGLVGAETFAAVRPGNNKKIYIDIEKLSVRDELNKYVFFCAPDYPDNKRIEQFKSKNKNVKVLSLDARLLFDRRRV